MRRRIPLLALFSSLLVLSAATIEGPANAREEKKKKARKKQPAPPVEVKPVWPSPLDPGALDSIFKELPFGKERTVFTALLQQHLEAQLKPVLRATLDPYERDQLREKLEKTFREIEESYVQFAGQETGYAVSVIEGEYCDNAGEGLMKYSYGDDTAYFFFSGGALWKLFICTQQTPNFTDLLAKLMSLYGDPRKVVYGDKEKTKVVEATWEDTTFRLTAAAPRGIFVCSRLSWTYLPMIPVVEELRKAAASQGKLTEAEQILLEVTKEPEKDQSDVVDRILKMKRKGKGD